MATRADAHQSYANTGLTTRKDSLTICCKTTLHLCKQDIVLARHADMRTKIYKGYNAIFGIRLNLALLIIVVLSLLGYGEFEVVPLSPNGGSSTLLPRHQRNSTQEIWVDIKNYEGCYQISNKGHVKNLEREVISGGITRTQSERILTHWCGKTHCRQHPRYAVCSPPYGSI